MSARPTDWSPVGYSCDPVPGDAAVVAEAARSYRTTAEAVGTAINNLRSIDEGNQHGAAISAVLDQIKKVRDNLDKVESRVSGAASALECYHPALSSAQQESLAALQEAEGCQEDRRHAVNAVNRAAHQHNTSNDPSVKESAKKDYEKASTNLELANAGISEARARIATAISNRDSAANTAISLLQEIEESSPIKDTWWDHVVEFCGNAADWIEKNLKPILETIAKVLDIASLVCTIAAAVLTVTGIGLPVAGVLFAVARGMSAVSLGISLALDVGLGLLKAIGGRQSWGDFALGALTSIGTVVLAKFIGKKVTGSVMGAFKKAAVNAKNTVVKQVAGWVTKNAKAVKPLVSKAVGKIVKPVVKGAIEGVKDAGSWFYDNVIKPVTTPVTLPQTQYRTCYSGAGGGGGSW